MGLLLTLMISLPLLGSVLNGLILRTPHARRAGVIATLFASTSFLIAIVLWLHTLLTKTPLSISFPWFRAGELSVSWDFLFDSLTAVMALVVTGIGTIIHIYSIGYMAEDATPARYFAYLNLFLFGMLVLICANNLPVMFVGWEGVGFCSYVLIGYWYRDIEKSNAGMKAFIVNRIGDAGFLIGIFLCWQIFHSLSFDSQASMMMRSSDLNLLELNLAGLFLFVGAMGKSAQIPLYVWLPDAMAGPTPVSALIHAATMVTAGVYLVARMGFLYQVTQETSFFIAIIGGFTAVFAATIATSQRDIKKVLAYSTVSQLGLMFLALGVRNYSAGIFHLVTHAFFKALLFLGAGSIIHALGGEQDICKMGGLSKKLPWTYLTFTIGTAALCGIPPFSGFVSKDEILFSALAADHHGTLLWGLGLFTSLLTAFYMARLYALVFLGKYRGETHPHESPSVMTIPLVILAVGSALAGLLGLPSSLHLLPNILREFLGSSIPVLPQEVALLSEHTAMGIAILISFTGVGLGLWLYGSDLKRSERAVKPFVAIQSILANKFWVDELYSILILRPFHSVSAFLANIFDVRLIDAAVLFPSRVCRAGATLLGLIQWGSAQFYLWVMLTGALIMFWLMMRGMVV